MAGRSLGTLDAKAALMQLRSLALSLVLPVLAGCGGTIVIADTTGPAGSEGTGGSVASKPTPPPTVADVRHALITTQPNPAGPCFNLGVSNPPGATFVIVSNRALACGADYPAELATETGQPGVTWEVCFAIDPASFAAGALAFDCNPYGNEGLAWGNVYEQDVDVDAPCGQSGGPLCETAWQGSLTLGGLDGSAVALAIAGWRTQSCNQAPLDVDGTYAATRCP
jgi:hypothetical protein